jgi:hypothetical protein
VGLLLMRRVAPGSDWTALLPGFVLAGAGVGMTNPAIASTAVGVVSPERSGMAAGINNTFRQVGIAIGIAALGAVFQSRIVAGVPGLRASGEALTSAPLQAWPPQVRPVVHAAFIGALDDVLLIGAVIAFAGALLSFALVRQRDFVARHAAASTA